MRPTFRHAHRAFGLLGRLTAGAGRRLGLALLALVLAACSEPPLATIPPAEPLRGGPTRFWEGNATLYWNGVARSLVGANRSSAPFAIRGYAIVSTAQNEAAVAAEKQRSGATQASVRAAVAGASVAALSYLYPGEASALEARLQGFLAAPAWPGEDRRDEEAGVAVGRTVGEQVVERAKTDGFFAPGTLTPPVGPGYWSSSTPPAGALFGRARTYLLRSADQFRPVAPPAFGSSEFLAALAEVRQISDTRTPQQVDKAVFWDAPAGTHTPAGHWNEEAARLAVKYHLNELRAAQLLALLNMVAFDAIVASHEAKYHYWLLRPTMADPGITLPIGLPNFPSYPSNHAAISAGMARILGDAFPAERRRLDALAEEAALSRVLGGIHYRFDGEAGLELGRRIADWALGAEPRDHPHGLLH
jgi:membrane-associated phospholipid phosphatase